MIHSLGARIVFRAIVLVFAIVALHRLVWLPWSANRILSEVEARSMVALNSGDTVRTALIARQNIEQLHRIAPATREDANYYMLYAANARFLGDQELAADLYTTALQRVDHRPEIYYERGLVYLQMGKVDRAVADLARAARFNPMVVGDLSGELQDRVKKAAGIP